jgi:hypothetical protein
MQESEQCGGRRAAQADHQQLPPLVFELKVITEIENSRHLIMSS